MSESPYFAAVDLGSNSFHMLVGRWNDGQIEVIDREKEMVQIARGLDERGALDEETMQRALDCLRRFSERLHGIPAEQVRAVGTKTLRAAKKSRQFLGLAQQALGHPIQIISGYEEARLVYCGFSHSIADDQRNRLVIDIGGGSTEFIIGKGHSPVLLESLNLGCVAFTKRFFSADIPFKKAMQNAYLEACSEIETIRKQYRARGWELAYGTSGTIRAIGDLCAPNSAMVINREALKNVEEKIIADEGVLDSQVPRLRREVLPAGLAVLRAIFDQLNVDEVRVADATLKEGLIYDTVGRFSNDDSREETVSKLMQRYSVDADQAQRVQRTALAFWTGIKEADKGIIAGVSRTKILKWAANVHEIGLSVSHSAHHNHGLYLLQHSDLAGFGRLEQFILANLVGFHRKKLRPERLSVIDESMQAAFLPVLLCLRLSVLFNRNRDDLAVLPKLRRENDRYYLQISEQWLQDNPLTQASLTKEISQLSNIGLTLSLDTAH